MKTSSLVAFTVLRLLAFFVPLAVLLLLNVNPWVSALVAAVVGFCISYIFLRRPREQVAGAIYERRHRETPLVHPDDETEDAAIDAAAATAAASPTAPTAAPGSAAASTVPLQRERRAESHADDQAHEARQLEGEDELR
ncbi:DUF4229 domain-containing protein [Rathayibacter sp. YIM 133350]|uniref:DUF4229 domain-containing protein n=1 Tax=Rathayibacter sp. YIM 133350 TaxID=3131992 RepID=UPI00307DD541